MPPMQVDFKPVGRVPPRKRSGRGVDTGFLPDFARRGRLERLLRPVEGAGDRLPEARPPGALEEQDLKVHRVNDHEHRDRNLRGHFSLKSAASISERSGSMNTAKNGLPRPAQNSAAAISTSIRIPRSSDGRN